jgi:hypothetical protein
VACLEVLVAEDTYNAGEGAVVRQGRSIALVVAFLIGCTVLLLVGCAGVRSEGPKEKQGRTEATASEEARCQGTRTFQKWGGHFTTNDLPGCPKGGLLLGTDKKDRLAGQEGDDKIRGLGGFDDLKGGPGNDILYGGDGDDLLEPAWDEDVIYGGDGNDWLGGGSDGQRDKLYCGEGKDDYSADKNDYVSSSCEKQRPLWSGHDVAPVQVFTSSASASPVPVPQSGGPAILLLAAALLLGSGILTYAILRRR